MPEKAPPAYNRPSSQPRPVDLNRFKSIDVQPENAQQDPEYQRMVQDIEALQQRQGWLRGRGAFDKDDLLYLRDKELEQRQREQDQREREAAAFAAARARAERQQQGPAKSTAAQPLKHLNKSGQGVKAVVKVKPQAKGQKTAEPARAAPQPSAKRQRLDSGTGAIAEAELQASTAPASGQQQQQQAQQPSAAGTAAAADSETGFSAIWPGRGGQFPSAHMPQAHETSAPDGNKPNKQLKRPASSAGLEGLLGYGSDDDRISEDGAPDDEHAPSGHKTTAGQQRQSQKAVALLPSAAELLEQDLHSSFAAEARRDTQLDAQVEEGPVRSGWHTAGAPVYQNHSGWV